LYCHGTRVEFRVPIDLGPILDDLPDDPSEAADKLLTAILSSVSGSSRADVYEALGTYVAFAQANNLSVPAFHPTDYSVLQLVSVLQSQSQIYKKQLTDRQIASALERGKERFAMKSGKLFVYEFTDTDVQEIQNHLNELRSLFSSSEELTEEHRKRLLRRLEQLQSELHKTMSDLDRFWGLVGDAGVAIRKFGEDSKNAALIVAAIYKLTMIIWKAQLVAHGLPFEPRAILPAPVITLLETAETEKP
jgi:hypothetical protein